MWILFVNDGTVHLSVVFPTFRTLVIISGSWFRASEMTTMNKNQPDAH
jgi:hypothetical protein